MNERNAKEFRNERANELRKLALVLLASEVIRDQEPLQTAASQAGKRMLIEVEEGEEEEEEEEEKEKQEVWGYRFYGLELLGIDKESSRHARPNGAEIMSIELSVSLSGPCLDVGDFSNPFSSLGVDIVALGLSADGRHDLKCAWHFDKHIQEKGDGKPLFAHPIYHFQHGGNNVSQLNNYGEHLILEPPRIAHPPLDAILAVDFVLSNYCGRKWASLHLDNTTYRDLIASAQERYWTPYALSTATICNSLTVDSSWSVQEIWPQMLIERVIRRTDPTA
jgi:hypothetical protein